MWIDVKIPYEPQERLADAYNRAMATSQATWVLLLDHDVYVALNPLWYDVCLGIVERLGRSRVGLITCRECGNYDDYDVRLCHYVKHAKKEYKQGLRLRQITRVEEVAGYFMLINHHAWKITQFRSIGKGVNKVDHDFARRLMEKKYELYMIDGLWVYHRRGVRKLRGEWKQIPSLI